MPSLFSDLTVMYVYFANQIVGLYLGIINTAATQNSFDATSTSRLVLVLTFLARKDVLGSGL
jgi:hypothetical protein